MGKRYNVASTQSKKMKFKAELINVKFKVALKKCQDILTISRSEKRLA